MIGIINYGAGNVTSVRNAMGWLNVESGIIERPEQFRNFGAIILPGVGAFGPAIEKLAASGLVSAIHEWIRAGKPFLGICLGMQLLARQSTENGLHAGLGIVDAQVVRMSPSDGVRIPHVGWNVVSKVRAGRLWGELEQVTCYHVHSYCLEFDNPRSPWIIGTAVHGRSFPSIIENDNVMGVQFHPEKSQRDGLTILSNFVRLAAKC